MTEIAQLLIHCLKVYYWIEVTTLSLLPIGADMSASIYKATAADQKTYFIKLKRNAPQLMVLDLLQAAGMQQLIAPIKTIEGESSQQIGDLTLVIYPFVQGENGFSRSLTDEQWIIFGKALRQVHEVQISPSIESHVRREDFSPRWRESVRSLYAHIEEVQVTDEIALKVWQFLKDKRPLIQQLVNRAEQLSQKFQNEPLKFVLCHSDIHGGNVLIDEQDRIYLVDWDHPILAPKERDLMFIGGGVGNVWNQQREEELFYQGYGPTEVNEAILTYYRCERIVEDIVLYAQELLGKATEGKDRQEMYKQFMRMFEPEGVVSIALSE